MCVCVYIYIYIYRGSFEYGRGWARVCSCTRSLRSGSTCCPRAAPVFAVSGFSKSLSL